jgi:uncharacterized protein (DUF362 family)
MAKVAIIKGEERRENVRRSLELIGNDISSGIGSRRIVIKPNFVSTSIQLASSHIDQIRGILDFLKDLYKEKVIIAEAACGDTEKAFINFGYHTLIDEYDVELMDLNKGAYTKVLIKDSKGTPFDVRVSSLLLNENSYLISAAKLKTHDTVVVTLSVKNMAMGAVLLPDKRKVHQGTRRINLNIAEIAGKVWPDLGVIDGLEGNGPVHGDPIHAGIAMAGTDPLAVDRVACELMGVDFSRVGYLNHCSDRELGEADIGKIDLLGEPLRECVHPFRLHSGVSAQFRWRA